MYNENITVYHKLQAYHKKVNLSLVKHIFCHNIIDNIAIVISSHPSHTGVSGYRAIESSTSNSDKSKNSIVGTCCMYYILLIRKQEVIYCWLCAVD